MRNTVLPENNTDMPNVHPFFAPFLERVETELRMGAEPSKAISLYVEVFDLIAKLVELVSKNDPETLQILDHANIGVTDLVETAGEISVRIDSVYRQMN